MINRISIAGIERFIKEKQNQGMKVTTIKIVLVALNQIMAYAVRHRLIDFNPTGDEEKPKARGQIDERREMRILTTDEVKKFIEAEQSQKFKALFIIAVMTGMRKGEILALKWSDIDFDKKQIQVRRTFNHGRFFEPKTRESIRKIDLAPMVVLKPITWELASTRNDFDLVFPSDAGTPMDCINLLHRHFWPLLKKENLPRIRFHDLRHTYASLLISKGENIKYIQNQLGHSTPTCTLNVYSHLLKDSKQEAACRLENAIFQGTGHKNR